MILDNQRVHLHNKSFDPFDKGRRWHKGETQVVQATPTAQPSTAEAITAWVNAMPQVFAEQQRQAPLEAQQQVDLATQYALPLAQAYQTANETLNPGTTALQTSLANQALQGSTATSMPDWMRKSALSDMNAQLGPNASSPIGADYVSRGMQKQLFNQQQYYQNMGMSLAGKQPLTTAQAPATNNYSSTFTPSNVMNYLSNNYGTYAQSSRPLGFTQSGGLFG